MKRVTVLLAIVILQTHCLSQEKGKATNQVFVGVASVLGSGSEVEFELDQNELGYAFQFDHFFTRTFTWGLEGNYVTFSNDDEEPQQELTGIPVMLTLKRYLWNSKFQLFLKVSGGPLLGWFEEESADTVEVNESEASDFKVGAAGGVFAGLDWRFFKGLGLYLDGGILWRRIKSKSAGTVLSRAGLLLRF